MHHTQKENLCVLSVLENSEQLKVITKHEWWLEVESSN